MLSCAFIARIFFFCDRLLHLLPVSTSCEMPHNNTYWYIITYEAYWLFNFTFKLGSLNKSLELIKITHINY